jgi:hypothetical protein
VRAGDGVSDLVSLGRAVGMVAYLSVGRVLRGWMPIFIYLYARLSTQLCSGSAVHRGAVTDLGAGGAGTFELPRGRRSRLSRTLPLGLASWAT